MEFDFTICPNEGFWRNGTFLFHVKMDKNYPFSSPTISCKNSIFHPNFDPDTKEIGLYILENWTAVLSLNNLIHSTQKLFFKPDCNKNVLNKFAKNLYLNNKQEFDFIVQRIINGCNMYQREWQCLTRNAIKYNYNNDNDNNNCNNIYKSNQIITKKSSFLGNRKRNFNEMSMNDKCNDYKNNDNNNKFIDDSTLLNPLAIIKKQRTNRNEIYCKQKAIDRKKKKENYDEESDDDDIDLI